MNWIVWGEVFLLTGVILAFIYATIRAEKAAQNANEEWFKAHEAYHEALALQHNLKRRKNRTTPELMVSLEKGLSLEFPPFPWTWQQTVGAASVVLLVGGLVGFLVLFFWWAA